VPRAHAVGEERAELGIGDQPGEEVVDGGLQSRVPADRVLKRDRVRRTVHSGPLVVLLLHTTMPAGDAGDMSSDCSSGEPGSYSPRRSGRRHGQPR